MQCPNCSKEIPGYSGFCCFCGARQAGAPARRLMRSSRDSKIGGVCGGLAEYLDVDPTIVRVVWILLLVFMAVVPAALAYLILWLIVPLAAAPAPAAVSSEAPSGPAPASHTS